MIGLYLFFRMMVVLIAACFWIFVITGYVLWWMVVGLFYATFWLVKVLIMVIALIVSFVRGRRAAIA